MSAQNFFNRAIGNNERPRIINIDKNGFNSSALYNVNIRS